MASKTIPKKSRRPTAPTKTLRARIFNKIADGVSVRKLCEDKRYPTRDMFYKWLREYPDFAEEYRIATELRADVLVDEMMDIADDDSLDIIIDTEADEGARVKADQIKVARAKVKIDTRKWVAARMAPRKYGNNVKVEAENKHDHSGGIDIRIVDYSEVELDDGN